jgi:hypothetical protein
MLTRRRQLTVPALVGALACTLAYSAAVVNGQTSPAEFQKLLQEKATFNETDLAALQRGETVVKVAPVQDKEEVAVSGLVSLRASADEFLRSYRESLVRTNNAAVMEIGTFSAVPTLADLQNLTLETQDIEDLKACVVGNCQIKLSSSMIERFTRDVNWQAPDYPQQATQLFKRMLIEYVQDYRARGDAALIQYHDKRDEVRLSDEQQALSQTPSYLNDVFASVKSSRANAELRPLDNLIVWSKIKFGLKPVTAINHVTIYRRESNLGPQVLTVSKQIYANHYFNSSLALTAFVTVAGPASYLVYENRSRADSLEGPFGNLKRKVVVSKALKGLKGILEQSKMTLEAPMLGRNSATVSANPSGGWGRRLFGGIRPLLWFLIISGLIALFALRNYEGKATRSARVKEIKL